MNNINRSQRTTTLNIGELTASMRGLEQFGHPLFTGPDAPAPRQNNTTGNTTRSTPAYNGKGRELVKTMLALEELGFHIFTGPGSV